MLYFRRPRSCFGKYLATGPSFSVVFCHWSGRFQHSANPGLLGPGRRQSTRPKDIAVADRRQPCKICFSNPDDILVICVCVVLEAPSPYISFLRYACSGSWILYRVSTVYQTKCPTGQSDLPLLEFMDGDLVCSAFDAHCNLHRQTWVGGIVHYCVVMFLYVRSSHAARTVLCHTKLVWRCSSPEVRTSFM